MKGSKFKMPKLNIKAPKISMPDVDLNLKGPKLKGEIDVSVPELEGDLKGPQVDIIYNYLKPKYEPRVTWDNKITWKMTKFFGIMLTTNLIYDPFVMVRDTDDDGKGDTKGVQFKEYFELGFTYTLSHKR